jgi:hypothetical protein
MNLFKAFALCALILGPVPLSSAAAAGALPTPVPQAHTRTLPAAPEVLFPKLLECLIDNDFILLAVNQPLGVITFRLQSDDDTNRQRKHVNVLEGTLLVQATPPTSTQVRVKLTLSWQESFSDFTFRTGAQKDADPSYYKGFLDLLEKRFAPSTP